MTDPKEHEPSHTIEIRLTLPGSRRFGRSVGNVRRNITTAWRRRIVRAVTGTILVVVAAGLAWSIIAAHRVPATGSKGDGSTIVRTDSKATAPDFKTILPDGKTIGQLGGWTRVSPADRNAAFAYVDTIGINRIVVSQQPLPGDFADDTEAQVAELAKGYKATEKLTVEGTTIHIADSAKGPQTIIFAKDGVLILARSSVKLSNDDWVRYISSLS